MKFSDKIAYEMLILKVLNIICILFKHSLLAAM